MRNSVNHLLILCALFVLHACSNRSNVQEAVNISEDIIPQPCKTAIRNGSFEWDASTRIVITDPCLQNISAYLGQILSGATSTNIVVEQGSIDEKNAIILALDNEVLGDETYKLEVNKNNIIIKASKPAGVFYGVQSLLQLMPAEVSKTGGLKNGVSIGAILIEDYPRFAYRGMHLDVSRHFFTVDEVKKYIDMLAMYKFNRFHWHLTDGAGWRIEIKKYPLLTQKAAFRPYDTYKEFWKGKRDFVDEGDPTGKGGYYTQEQIKDVVAYAADRFITIIPEIEMPGHSEEVFVAYPHLSCSGKAYQNSDYCAGNEESFTFLEDVLTEVIDLFPSEYIHIGGDEAQKSAWKTCPKCKKRMEEEYLENVDQLQSYFIKRISDFVASKNRKIIGWDEILEGGLANGATVMVWRGEEKATETASQMHNVIMTPGNYCYFDYYQDNPATEPEAIGGYTPLSKVYSFPVVPHDSIAPFILGGQANIWTEYIPDFKQVEYMVFPRAIALSEALWSPQGSKDWENFKLRLNKHLPRLDYKNVNYHKPSPTPLLVQTVDTLNKKIGITFDTEIYKPVIRYTTDGSTPSKDSELYNGMFYIDTCVTIKAGVFVDDKLQEPYLTKNAGYHKAIGKKVTYHNPWTAYPAGGETALTDGYRGGLSYVDKLWQGFTKDLDVTIDLGSITTLNSFAADFMQLTGPGVYMPVYVNISLSEDGVKFKDVLNIKNDLSPDHNRLVIKEFGGSLNGEEARYIKVFAKNQKGFLFVDELVVN